MLRTILTLTLVLPAAAGLAEPARAAAAATPRCHGMPATIVGTPGDDRIRGTRGPDVVVALDGNDWVVGLGGDDVLCGNGGSDDLVGGLGNDQVFGGRDGQEQRVRRTLVLGDLLEGGPGDDHLDAGYDEPTGRVGVLRHDGVTYRHSARAVTVDLDASTATGEGRDVLVPGRHLELTGSPYDDVLHGSDLPETLDGDRGADQVFGGGGRDAVVGFHGDDQLHGEAGPDFVLSTSGVATVDGGEGRDWLIADSARPATMLGGDAFDYLSRRITTGETGVIDGGGHRDQLELVTQLWFDREPSAALDAAAGTAVVTAGDDTQTTEFASVDAFTLWGSPWSFSGSDGEDFVQVLDDRMEAQGLGGDDYLLGGSRSDVLDGGEGTDEAWGGRGRDTCIDTELGDCDAYPWDSRSTTRARVVGHDLSSLARTSPRRLLSRWQDHRPPFAGR